MTDEENRYWVGRCLQLEREIAILKGYYEAPLLPEIERRSLYPEEAAPHLVTLALPLRLIARNATPEDIAKMRELSARGFLPTEIAYRLQFSHSTVRRHIRDILIEREVGAT